MWQLWENVGVHSKNIVNILSLSCQEDGQEELLGGSLKCRWSYGEGLGRKRFGRHMYRFDG